MVLSKEERIEIKKLIGKKTGKEIQEIKESKNIRIIVQKGFGKRGKGGRFARGRNKWRNGESGRQSKEREKGQQIKELKNTRKMEQKSFEKRGEVGVGEGRIN